MTNIFAILLIGSTVTAGGSSSYVSEYSIESIVIQEAFGLAHCIKDSDEYKAIVSSVLKAAFHKAGLTRLPEILRAGHDCFRTARRSLTAGRTRRGGFWYSYSGTIRGIRIVRRTDISPGRLTTSVRLTGRIRSESRRQGPAVGTGTLTGVTVTVDAEESDRGTTILVRVGAVVAVSVRGRSHCRIVVRAVSRRGPAIAARTVGAEANARCQAAAERILAGGVGVAARGRENSVVGNLAEHGLNVGAWD